MLAKKIKLSPLYIYKHPYYKKLFKNFRLENAEKYYLETFLYQFITKLKNGC